MIGKNIWPENKSEKIGVEEFPRNPEKCSTPRSDTRLSDNQIQICGSSIDIQVHLEIETFMSTYYL